MNFVKNIIDDLEKIESMNKDSFKYFLFIVYMKRELFTELKNNKINKKDNSLAYSTILFFYHFKKIHFFMKGKNLTIFQNPEIFFEDGHK